MTDASDSHPCCPRGHRLALAEQTSSRWRCDGAVLPAECTSNISVGVVDAEIDTRGATLHGDGVDADSKVEIDSSAAISNSKVKSSRGDDEGENQHAATTSTNNESLPTSEDDRDSETNASSNARNSYAEKLFQRYKSCDKSQDVPRYCCSEGCNFDLCSGCFDFLKRKEEDRLDEVEERLLIDEGMMEMIQYLRRASLQLRQPVVPFNRNAYKRAVHASGRNGTRQRCEWLTQRFLDRDASVEDPILAPRDICDETLLAKLTEIASDFSESARKKALFFTGNVDVQSARNWLLQNANDPLLNKSIPSPGKIRVCPNGHSFVPSLSPGQKRWICDGDSDIEGCRRGQTSENYNETSRTRRFICEMPGCSFNVCDDCIFRSKPRKSWSTDDAGHDNEEDVGCNDEEVERNVEKKAALGKETFQIYDGNEKHSSSRCLHFDTYQPWADKVKELTGNAKVISHHTFKSPLTNPLGDLLKNVKFPGPDHHIHHRYIVLGLVDQDGHRFFLSADKNRSGILIQIHEEFERVALHCLGPDEVEARYNPVEIESKELTGIHRFEYVNLPFIGDLLMKWEIMAQYDLWGSNCQTLAGDLRNRVLKASNGVQLHLPGTDSRASINDYDKLMLYFKSRYPGWQNQELVHVPQLQIQYAVRVEQENRNIPVQGASDEVEEMTKSLEEAIVEKEYEALLLKQMGYEGVCKALRSKSLMNKWNKGSKAIFCHISRDKSEEALNQAQIPKDIDTSIFSEILREFWRANYEFLVVTSHLGVLIFDYGEETNTLVMNSRVLMLQELGEFTELCISTISIVVDEAVVKPEVSGPEVIIITDSEVTKVTNPESKEAMNQESKVFGQRLHFKIHVSKQDIEHDLRYCMDVIGKMIDEKIAIRKNLRKRLERLVTKITLLQNLENETNLVHHKLENQEWGKSGVMLWTEGQRRCLSFSERAFRAQGKPLRLIIRGCQGSGKTLLIMRIAKEFCKYHKEGFFLIHIKATFSQLTEDLREHVQEDPILKGRVRVGAFQYLSHFHDSFIRKMDENEDKATASHYQGAKFIECTKLTDIAVFCFDEAEFYGGTGHKFSREDEEKLRMVLPNHHIVLATSKTNLTAENVNLACNNAKLNHQFQEQELEGNLRSSPPISHLTKKYQLLNMSNMTNIPIKTTLAFASPPPKIVTTKSEDRVDFEDLVLQAVKEALLDSQNVHVTVMYLCHLSLVDRMKSKMTKDDMRRVSFRDPMNVLGCQFAVVIMAIDLATLVPGKGFITNMLTRGTTIVNCVINTTLSPLMINGRPSFSTTRCDMENVPAFLNKLISQSEGKGPIFVWDISKQISEPIRAILGPRVVFDWWVQKDYENVFERTRQAAVLVEVTPPTIVSTNSQRSHAPVLELVIMRKNDKDGSRDYDRDYRKPMIRFFENYRVPKSE